jgi:sugar phosphate isomerase/epimerase
LAADLQSDCVSCWSGIVLDDVSPDIVWERLSTGLEEVLIHAEHCGVTIGFEPEPGMFIDTMDRYAELRDRIQSDRLQLTLDIGHLHCLGETPLAEQIRKWSQHIVNVHLEDMLAGVHEHLMFGAGEIDFGPVFAAFQDVDYRGGLHVELSRHSHEAPLAAAQAVRFLRPFVSG